MQAVCHTLEEIERAARRLSCVPTDNRDALLEAGFERMYPQARSGYDSRLWMRSVDLGNAERGARKRVVQRAYLDDAPRR